jgi:hypothetical protein
VADTAGGNEKSERLATATAAGRLLVQAHELVQASRGWTKRALARDRHSHPVSPTSDRAVRFCASGALLRAAGERFGFSLRPARKNESATFVAPEPLAEAYRVVGAVIVESFFPIFGIEVADDDDQGLTVSVPLLHLGEDDWPERMSWRELLETVNDARGVGHQAIVGLLRLSIVEAAERIFDVGGTS